VTLGMNHMN